MTDLEKYVRLVLDNVYTSLPCKVLEYDKQTRFAKCELCIKTENEGNGIIVRVPILRMIGGSVPLKVGMIIPVFFSKYSIGEFAVSLSNTKVEKALKSRQFSRDSAYGLPFVFDDKLNISMPEFVEFDTKVIFKESVECEKDVLIKSTLDVEADTNIKANLTVTGALTSQGNLSSPNYNSHTHTDAEGRATSSPK